MPKKIVIENEAALRLMKRSKCRTINDVARRAGISHRTVKDFFECRRMPSAENLFLMALALETDGDMRGLLFAIDPDRFKKILLRFRQSRQDHRDFRLFKHRRHRED